MDENKLKSFPNSKIELIRLFHILKGIVSGLNSNRNFSLFFEWFYPDYFQIINKALSAFIEEDDLVLIIFKFLAELVNNRSSRLRFDTWNINGIIVNFHILITNISLLGF